MDRAYNNWFNILVVIALILIFIAMAGIGIPAFADLIKRGAPSEFERRDAIIRECLQTERYTVDQCIAIANGKNQ